jgi:hypothetical protein
MEPTRPELRPLGVGEMVDAAIRLYRTNFLTLIKISAVILGPIGLIQLIATIAVGPVDCSVWQVVDPETTPAEVFEPLIPIYTVLAITSLFSFLGSVLVEGASLTVLAHHYRGEETDWKDSLRVGWGRFLPLIAATILVSLGAGFGLIFCLVPGVFLFTMWAVTPAALVTERLGPFAAMGRSYQLVRGRFWPVLGAIVLAYLLYMVANQIIGVVTGVTTVLGSLDGEQISFLPSVIGSVLVSIVAAPFLAAMITVIYFDLRVRKEGYDLELMAQDLRQIEGDAAPPPEHDDPFGLGTPGDR